MLAASSCVLTGKYPFQSLVSFLFPFSDPGGVRGGILLGELWGQEAVGA